MEQWKQNLDLLCKESLANYCKMVLPEAFGLPYSQVIHLDQLFPILDDPTIKRVVIETSRDVGKSAIMKGLVLKAITYQEVKYPMWCSQTEKIAGPYSRQIQLNLERNKILRARFGDLTSDRWARGEWMTSNGIFMRTLGMGQQVRSAQTEDLCGSRPDLGILDDAQDVARCKNPDIRKSDLEWFTGEFEPAFTPEARLIVIGNAVHCDSLIRSLAKMEGWVYLRLAICDENLTESYWEEHHPIAKLRVRRDNLRLVGQSSTFYREVLAQPMPPPEDRAIRSSDLIPYSVKESQLDSRMGTFSFVIADPARTVKMSSAHSAILGVTVDPREKKIYIRRMVDGKFEPADFLTHLFHAADSVGAAVICVEKTGLEDWLELNINTYQIEHNKNYECFLFQAGKDPKMERFKEAVPYFLYHQVEVHPDILDSFSIQVLTYGHTARRDVGDCVAYIPRMMNEFRVIFEAVRQILTKQDVQEEEDEHLYDLFTEDEDPTKMWQEMGIN